MPQTLERGKTLYIYAIGKPFNDSVHLPQQCLLFLQPGLDNYQPGREGVSIGEFVGLKCPTTP